MSRPGRGRLLAQIWPDVTWRSPSPPWPTFLPVVLAGLLWLLIGSGGCRPALVSGSSSSSDEAAFRAAADACKVENLRFEQLAASHDQPADPSTVKPVYQVNVTAACGGFSEKAARVRRLHNGKFDCVAKRLARSGVDVRPTCSVILE